MKKTGFYIIKDSFFTYVDDPYLKGNKEDYGPVEERCEIYSDTARY